MKYYVMPKNHLGLRPVMSAAIGTPSNMDGVDIVELPNGKYLTVISKGKEYPAERIAAAIAVGQIKIDDVK